MKARFSCIAVLAVLLASGAQAQTDTATTGGTPPLTADTAGLGAGTTTATTDTALGAAATTTTTADTTIMTSTVPATPVMTEDTSLATTTTTQTEDHDEGGFDWNWLGLLGLLGLTGLFKNRGTRTEVVHHDTVRPVTTGRNDPPGTRPRV